MRLPPSSHRDGALKFELGGAAPGWTKISFHATIVGNKGSTAMLCPNANIVDILIRNSLI